jgi:hypothetical protein
MIELLQEETVTIKVRQVLDLIMETVNQAIAPL